MNFLGSDFLRFCFVFIAQNPKEWAYLNKIHYIQSLIHSLKVSQSISTQIQ